MTATDTPRTGQAGSPADLGTRLRGPERMRSTGWRWSTVRWVALVGYVVGLAVFVATQGIPTDRLGIYGGILVLLTIVVLGRGWDAWWQMMVDWLPFQAVLLAYDHRRGFASPYSAEQVRDGIFPTVGVHNGAGIPLHVMFPIHADRWLGDHLGLGTMPTTWVQEHFHPTASIPWYGALVSLVYCSHF